MSIDAIINRITTTADGKNLRLDLMSRESPGSRGQAILTIRNFTHKPAVGQQIWGGSGNCIIEPGHGITEQRHYYRRGYTKLEEAF